MTKGKSIVTAIALPLALTASGQTPTDTTLTEQTLDGVTVTARQNTRRSMGATNVTELLRGELFKAACCNLGESFVTNPSVDVNYSDAATGAKQLKLLGLGGTYVQLLAEQLPAFRGAALPYALSYVPGSWMKSLQVSKGNASVKNGYESMTGQVNIEYLKPEDDEGMTVNLYGNTMGRMEANVDGNIHVAEGLATEVLGHAENQWTHHDGNGDGFQDEPQVRQYNLQNRWYWHKNSYLFHGGLALTDEHRQSGQTHSAEAHDGHLFKIGIDSRRYEAYMKHALMLRSDRNESVALMGNVAMHEQDATYGHKHYTVNQKTAYASLMYEGDLAQGHNLSTGISLNYDYLSQNLMGTPSLTSIAMPLKERETTPGAYAQYTFNRNNKLIIMAGLRLDHSSIYGTFLTPRLHIKWVPSDIVTLRLSAGKGYRSPHALAELNYLMASGRTLVIDQLQQEEAWNMGMASSFYIPLDGRTLKVNAEYYYTRFAEQMVIDYDSHPHELHISNLHGRSYSHTFQVDANYTTAFHLELTAAYRYNLVKTTYGGGPSLWKPLQSRYKALFSGSWKPGMGLWQLDATLALNGGGRMPTPYTLADGSSSWASTFKAYPTLNAQVTRQFRHFSIYAGGENLTGYKQKHPIINAADPWGDTFEPTMVFGPVTGAVAYAGVRINLGKHL